MEFGVPNRKTVSAKVEKFVGESVITLKPFAGAKTARQIVFSKTAAELMKFDFNLEIDATVSFSFDTVSKEIFAVNSTGVTGTKGVKVGKTSLAASDKKYYDYIKEILGSTPEAEVNLIVTTTGKNYNGMEIFQCKLYTESVEESTNVDAFPVAEAVVVEPAAAIAEEAKAVIEAPVADQSILDAPVAPEVEAPALSESDMNENAVADAADNFDEPMEETEDEFDVPAATEAPIEDFADFGDFNEFE